MADLIAAPDAAERRRAPPPPWTWHDAAEASWRRVYAEAAGEPSAVQIARPQHRAAALVKEA